MPTRCGAATILAFGKIWLFGGGDCGYSNVRNDIWSSEDGINWTEATVDGSPKPAEWPARMWPCLSRSESGTLWLFGGYSPLESNGVNMKDLWYSKDGVSWKQLSFINPTVPWRHAPTCYADLEPNKLIVVAGKTGTVPSNAKAAVRNDVSVIRLPTEEFLP
jgi:hypothetical protein